MNNLPRIQKQCRVCKYCQFLSGNNHECKFLCLADNKKYITDKINDNGDPVCFCLNNMFSYQVPGYKPFPSELLFNKQLIKKYDRT